jgi:hypothetical protein
VAQDAQLAGSGQEKKAFEGNIRAFTTNNLSEIMNPLTKDMEKASDKAEEAMDNLEKATKRYKVFLSRKVKNEMDEGTKWARQGSDVSYAADELISGIDGDSESLFKIKGNKIANMDVKSGMLLIFDGDKREAYIAYPSVEAAVKYTFEEYKNLSTDALKLIGMTMTKSVEQVPNDTIMLLDYVCNKEILSMTQKSATMEIVTTAQRWCTDQISLPSVYYEIFEMQSFPMRIDMKSSNGMKVFTETVEIEETEVSNSAFVVPANYDSVDMNEIMARLGKIGKAKKGKAKKGKSVYYTLGDKIPDTFWDF